MNDYYALDPNAIYVMELPEKTTPEAVKDIRDSWEAKTSAQLVLIVGGKLLRFRGNNE